MIVRLIKGSSHYVPVCIDSLMDSDLGLNYFPTRDKAQDAILEFLDTDYFLVAVDENDSFLGFVCYLPTGAFHSFPYLHILITARNFRGQGIGTLIMDSFEELIFKSKDKLFLVVADFNPGARNFYLKRNYREIGPIPSLYRKGINELLMMKTRE